MVTLGCDKNTVDSERILSELVGAGVEVVEGAEDADVVVVNTCGFIEIAKQESIETLLEAARLKEAGRVRAVVGMGCLVQRYRPELEREMPEVDLFLGLTDADQLVPELARRGLVDMDGPVMERPLRVLTGATSRHSAHLKISEGCDHTCAFCAIPLMRGKFRSTPMGLLVREARELESQGVVELNVVSQDTTWYGRDWARRRRKPAPASAPGGAQQSYFLGRPFDAMPNLTLGHDGHDGHDGPARGHEYDDDPGYHHGPVPRTGALPLLLEQLLAETTIPWIRLFYMYPSGITRELVELIAREERILSYLDMPIQHASDRVLKRMRRPERRATILERVRWLREAVPDLALRTTVIVGFPGETEDDFETLLELLDQVGFDHLGAFAYSEEEDTAAATMSDAVPGPVRRERLERLLDHQRVIAMERNDARVGQRARVLVEEAVDGVAIGRASWQAPEVDGVVHIEGADGLMPGRFVDVVITSADDYDLTGRITG
jgi:ribosomal protein S12 methylthiotransferase